MQNAQISKKGLVTKTGAETMGRASDKPPVRVTDSGHRVGDSHPRSKLTDEQIDLVRDWYDGGLVGYRALAEVATFAFGVRVSPGYIRDVVKCRGRYGVATRFL